MTKCTEIERAEAFANLREWIKPGDTVYTILESCAKSGMSRWIRVVLIGCADGKPKLTHPNHAVAAVLGLRRGRDHEGMFISGCGMDMGYEIVYRLGEALWPDGTHALNHRWL